MLACGTGAGMTTSETDHVGRVREDEDTLRPELLARLAATLGVAVPDTLPLSWHWGLFQEWAAPGALGADGHPARGGFMPPLHDLPRRMWAGGEVEELRPVRPGEILARRSTITDVSEKQGGSGRLVFVAVLHEIAGEDGPAIRERQTIVYRGAEGAAVRDAAPAAALPPGGMERMIVPDPVLLFRYSALTGNGHRIHYDADYVRGEEGYPGLIVHGPLQATLLAGLAGQAHPSRRVTRLRFRGVRPAFASHPLRVQGWAEGDGYEMRTLDPSGSACMLGRAWIS